MNELELTSRQINDLNRKIFCTPDRHFLKLMWWGWKRSRLIRQRDLLRKQGVLR